MGQDTREMDRRVGTPVDGSHPTLAGWSEDSFRRLPEPLREQPVTRQDATCPAGPSNGAVRGGGEPAESSPGRLGYAQRPHHR